MVTLARRTALAAAAALALTPRSAASALDGPRRHPLDTIAARRRFFGPANVDARGHLRRDRVVLSWFGVSNFAMAIGGRVVLLDAWVPRGTYSSYVPADVDDLVALRPPARWPSAPPSTARRSTPGAAAWPGPHRCCRSPHRRVRRPP